MLQVIKESAFLFLAFGIGVYTFKKLDLFYKVIFFQVVMAVAVYLSSYAITLYQRKNGLQLNNQWLFNVYVFLEAILLIVAGLIYFEKRKVRLSIMVCLILFLLVFWYQILTMGSTHFANYALIAEGVILILIYFAILYTQFSVPSFSWRASPEFWLCIGLIVYFGCNVPFMSMIHYMNLHYPKLNELLFHFITDVLGNMRYFFVTISFWLFFRQHTMKVKVSYE